MTQVQTNVAISATTRDQRIRELTNEALSDYEFDLRAARRWVTGALTKDGDDKAADFMWAAILADAAWAEVVARLERMGVE